MASMVSLLIALWGTQIRGLPFSLYRSLAWRRALLIAIGVGLALFGGVSFYFQDPPVSVPVLHLIHWFLHGKPPDYDFGYGTPLWSLIALAGVLLLWWGLKYDPIKKLRNTIITETDAIVAARNEQLTEILDGSKYETLGPAQKQLYQEAIAFYGDILVRYIDALIGAAPPSFYRRFAVRSKPLPLTEVVPPTEDDQD